MVQPPRGNMKYDWSLGTEWRGRWGTGNMYRKSIHSYFMVNGHSMAFPSTEFPFRDGGPFLFARVG